jgi:hypothetical protein
MVVYTESADSAAAGKNQPVMIFDIFSNGWSTAYKAAALLVGSPLIWIEILTLGALQAAILSRTVFVFYANAIASALVLCLLLGFSTSFGVTFYERSFHQLIFVWILCLFLISTFVTPISQKASGILYALLPIMPLPAILFANYLGFGEHSIADDYYLWIAATLTVIVLIVVIALGLPVVTRRGLSSMSKMDPKVAGTVSAFFALLIILLGFWLLNDTLHSLFWLLFIIISYPIVLAIFLRPDSIASGDIRSMYRDGVRNIPVIGKLFRFPGPERSD